MNANHTLETLSGINPNTARKLFGLLSEEYEDVSWGDFYRFSGGSRLKSLRKASRWVPGYLFRDYFAECRAEVGRRFVKLYSEKAHKPSENAYDDAPAKETKSNATKTKTKSNVSPALSAAGVAALKSEIALLDALIERRTRLNALREEAA